MIGKQNFIVMYETRHEWLYVEPADAGWWTLCDLKLKYDIAVDKATMLYGYVPGEDKILNNNGAWFYRCEAETAKEAIDIFFKKLEVYVTHPVIDEEVA